MRREHATTRDVRDERGSITILVAIMIPALIVVIGVVVIAAGWYEHKRHLQGQVDAAALAGAQVMVCGGAAVQPAVLTEVNKYISLNGRPAGLESYSAFQSNLNDSAYPLSGKADSDIPSDRTCLVDVKATEQNVLPIFGKAFAGIVPFVSAHARIQAFKADTLSGAIPVGVEDSTPNNAWVQFVDENNGGAAIGTPVPLASVGGSWTSAASPLTISSTRIGARIILSGSGSNTCGGAYVSCYDLGSANGLTFIHGYDATATSGSQPTPMVRNVTLSNVSGSCTDPYFTVVTATCKLAVHASIDMGPSADPSKPANQGGFAASVSINGKPLVYDTNPASPTFHMWNSNTA